MSSEAGHGRDFCHGCDRRCCSRPVVLPHERENILIKARMGFLQSRRVFEKRDGYYIVKGDTCPFLKGKACSVEEVMPLNCRVFPLALSREKGDAEWELSPDCPKQGDVSHDFVDRARELGRPLLERHREKGPLI